MTTLLCRSRIQLPVTVVDTAAVNPTSCQHQNQPCHSNSRHCQSRLQTLRLPRATASSRPRRARRQPPPAADRPRGPSDSTARCGRCGRRAAAPAAAAAHLPGAPTPDRTPGRCPGPPPAPPRCGNRPRRRAPSQLPRSAWRRGRSRDPWIRCSGGGWRSSPSRPSRRGCDAGCPRASRCLRS